MKIRPKISKFQQGGVPLWYLNLYKQHALNGWNNTLRYNYADLNLNSNDHYNAGDLETVYRKLSVYTGTPEAVGLDIQSFYNSDGGNMTAEEFVKFYNLNAEKIRNHWASDLTYNTSTAGDHNRLYRRMFLNRSNTSLSPGSEYNIGYLEGMTKGGYDIQNIEGSSTWLRRMDRYEKEFDPNNPDLNRIHEITLKDGSKVKVYKKANGDIGLLSSAPNQNNQNLTDPNKPYSLTGYTQDGGYGFDWSKIGEGLRRFGPDLIAAGRLAGNLWNNERVFKESLAGVRPDLKQTYRTHRQVVGDEATKQAYYTRAAEGLTKAARPFTSDADRQMAYQYEAKRVGDLLRAEGDRADNTEIRRTSDESNQHQWANTQRATEVANANIASINRANAMKLNLKAQKLSADWTSIDNELLERETRMRKKQARNQAIRDLIFAIDEQEKLLTDKEYTSLYEAMDAAWDAALKRNNNDVAKAKLDPEFRKARELYLLKLYQLKKRELQSLLDRPQFGKSGIKITFKSKDDLLYKTARDAADHFRKMSKISSDALNRKPVKIEKLTSHPKGNAKYKYLQGGVAPFTIYRPATVGGESTISSQTGDTTSTSSKGSGKKDKDEALDMIKDLFGKLVGKGLPSDTNSLFKSMRSFLGKAEAFGTELSTSDISSMYLSIMELANTIEHLKANYEDAKKQAIENDAMGEIAVSADGKYAVLDAKTREIKTAKLDEIKKSDGKLIPLTNEQVLKLRALNVSNAFDTDLDGIVSNGIGLNKIAEYVKSILPSIKSNEMKTESYINNKVTKGIKALEQAPEGDYKQTITDKNNKEEATYALNFIMKMLPKNMQSVLEFRALSQGTDSKTVLASLIGSQSEHTVHVEYDAVTGKAAKDANGNKKDPDTNDIKSNPIMLMIQQEGGVPRAYELITRDSKVKMSVNGTAYPSIPKVSTDMSVDAMLSQSGFDVVLDSKEGITFGDLNIKPEHLKDIMYSNSGGMIVTLPCKIVNGHKEVNLGVRDAYEEVIEKLQSLGITLKSPDYNKALGEALREKGLTSLLDSKGYPDKTKFAEFLVVEAYATTKVKEIDTKSLYVEKVGNPDKELEERMIRALSTDSNKNNYSLDIDYWFYGDDVYRGTMFIPLNNNLNASINAWGDLIKVDESRDLENKYLNFNKASTMKSSNSKVLYETE